MKAARIVVLVVAVAAGGMAAMLAGRSNDPPPVAVPPPAAIDTVDVLVAKADIGMGHAITPNDIEWKAWPTGTANGQHFVRKTDKPRAIEELTGSLTRTPFVTGEPIREAKLIKANGSGFMAAILPSGMRAVSTEVSAETGAGGFILPNDRVDVILTRRDRDAEKKTGTDVHTSETILNNIRVLAIDQTVEEKAGQRVVVGKTATLELTPAQAETLMLSRQLGTMSLALRSLADADKPVVVEEKRGRGGEINVTRFGVTTTTTTK
jgi:pilus assembly protein CpaB